MTPSDDHRQKWRMFAVVTIALSVSSGVLAACGSSDVGSTATVPATQPAAPTTTAPAPTTIAAPAMTTPMSTTPVATEAPTATEPASAAISVTDADVADLEKQLDDIDQLLAGVDADLKQD